MYELLKKAKLKNYSQDVFVLFQQSANPRAKSKKYEFRRQSDLLSFIFGFFFFYNLTQAYC